MIFKLLLTGAIILSTGVSATTHVYYEGNYSPTHWAMKRVTPDDPHFIAKAIFRSFEYTIYLNPTDSRGYRSIICLTDPIDLSKGYNRDYSPEERIGLNLLIALVTQVYAKIGLEAQSAVAGNNSHSFDPEMGITYIGSSKEPSMLHGHIFGRGNPQGEYIEGVKLGGPIPGELFDMRGITLDVPGNDTKTKWKPGEMSLIATRIKNEIESILADYETLGLAIIPEVIKP